MSLVWHKSRGRWTLNCAIRQRGLISRTQRRRQVARPVPEPLARWFLRLLGRWQALYIKLQCALRAEDALLRLTTRRSRKRCGVTRNASCKYQDRAGLTEVQPFPSCCLRSCPVCAIPPLNEFLRQDLRRNTVLVRSLRHLRNAQTWWKYFQADGLQTHRAICK